MIFTNDFSTTFEKSKERIKEKPILNGSTDMTIGAKSQSTADVVLLEIETTNWYTQTEWNVLQQILYNYTENLYYKPSRLLHGKALIEYLKVNILSSVELSQTLRNNGKVDEVSYEMRIKLEEVLY